MTTAQLWWRNPNGEPYAYLAEDAQWFYTTTGEQVATVMGVDYSPTGTLMGTVDDQADGSPCPPASRLLGSVAIPPICDLVWRERP